MRKLFLFYCLLFWFHSSCSQEGMIEVVRTRIDSIITLTEKEKEENKKAELLLSIYTVSIDGYPVLLFETYQKLYLLGQQRKDIIIESSAWSFLGQGFRLSGDYVKALECHQKAVALAEKSGNPVMLGQAQNQLAHIYKDRQENEKALNLYRAAYENVEKSGNTKAKWWPSMNIGAVYLNMGNLDSSLFYSNRALQLFNTNEANLDYILMNIGSVYSRKGDALKAKKYFTEALEIAREFQSPRFFSATYVAIADHFHRNHEYDSAVYYAKKAVEAVQNTIISNLALRPARLLAELYQSRNADSSLKYWKVYMAANDSLYSTRANQQLMMMSFEEDRRKQELATEKLNYQNKIRTNLMLGGLAIVILIALILYRNSRQRRKANIVLEKTLSDLKATQSQLIQSEKMASLGELTAGIAHEIQNPLNFVNNFSEVSNELIGELKSEKAKSKAERDDQLEGDLLNDISQNLEKINHHGKRADAIVKGMLQHSRSSNNVKEPANINALADEYLRLAYHGLRAKDKSFNVTLKTDYDETIGNISIIPQDMGRVILNLITNAFYVVDEKKKSGIEGYEPIVSVSTKKTNGKIEIKVADNGNGISQKIMDKIFQPFFTTKPTGQGTGLGLSLSYDIVKTHGGEINVETKEKEGTTFTIVLPSV